MVTFTYLPWFPMVVIIFNWHVSLSAPLHHICLPKWVRNVWEMNHSCKMWCDVILHSPWISVHAQEGSFKHMHMLFFMYPECLCLCICPGWSHGAGHHQSSPSAGEAHCHHGPWEDAMVSHQNQPPGRWEAALLWSTARRQVSVSYSGPRCFRFVLFLPVCWLTFDACVWKLLVVFVFYQSEGQGGVWYFCSLHDVRENSLPLSDSPRQIREILHAGGNKVWYYLAGRASKDVFLLFFFLYFSNLLSLLEPTGLFLRYNSTLSQTQQLVEYLKMKPDGLVTVLGEACPDSKAAGSTEHLLLLLLFFLSCFLRYSVTKVKTKPQFPVHVCNIQPLNSYDISPFTTDSVLISTFAETPSLPTTVSINNTLHFFLSQQNVHCVKFTFPVTLSAA